ncbi:MAG TPA: lysophospholipid acyltransferase family protein [Hyphomicrobiales bacterium]|nr:lysophospholipid acyltransferase family protein [Hyphomicrobiales bacterium]
MTLALGSSPAFMLLDLRHRLEFGFLLLIAAMMRALPLDVATAVSARLWRWIAPKTRRHRRALKNLAKAMPEKSEAEREAIALAMWDNLGRVAAETFQLDRVAKDPSRIEFENPELIARYKDKAGAIVIAGPHMGNWEIGILPVHAVNQRPAGVYRVVENPYVDRYIHRKRAFLYPGGLFASKGEEGFNTVMRIASYVRAGGALGLLADLADWKGVQVPFFGHLMWASIAPAWLARRAGARLFVGRVIRLGKQSRFNIAVSELKVPRTDNADHDIKMLTAAIHRQFEAWIREHPEQWMWSNKRWKDEEMPGGSQS